MDRVGFEHSDGSSQLMARVREGMVVVDAAGEEIGTVTLVKIGDPRAITSELDDSEQSGTFGTIAEVFGGDAEPDVPEPLRSHLSRIGFVKIDSNGLFARDRYAAADAIADVSGATVRLKVTKADLIKED